MNNACPSSRVSKRDISAKSPSFITHPWHTIKPTSNFVLDTRLPCLPLPHEPQHKLEEIVPLARWPQQMHRGILHDRHTCWVLCSSTNHRGRHVCWCQDGGDVPPPTRCGNSSFDWCAGILLVPEPGHPASDRSYTPLRSCPVTSCLTADLHWNDDNNADLVLMRLASWHKRLPLSKADELVIKILRNIEIFSGYVHTDKGESGNDWPCPTSVRDKVVFQRSDSSGQR